MQGAFELLSDVGRDCFVFFLANELRSPRKTYSELCGQMEAREGQIVEMSSSELAQAIELKGEARGLFDPAGAGINFKNPQYFWIITL